MTPDEIRLDCTCDACPEQYDAHVGTKEVGYIRLRWGRLRVECPWGGDIVLQHDFPDALLGQFPSLDERSKWLRIAREKIAEYWNTPEQDRVFHI